MSVRCLLVKATAPHFSTLAWEIPWMEEPGRLQSMGSWRVRHDWATSLSLFTFMHWRRKWQPTPVFLPGESQGLQSLVGCRLWGCTESDTTEATEQGVASVARVSSIRVSLFVWSWPFIFTLSRVLNWKNHEIIWLMRVPTSKYYLFYKIQLNVKLFW